MVVVAPLLALVLMGVACSGSDAGDGSGASPAGSTPGLPATPAPSLIPAEDASTPTIPVPVDFVVPDTRNVVLAPVLGRKGPDPDLDVNVVPIRGGRGTVTAQVTGPDGRGVAGATVRFERFVGPFKGWEDVSAGRDGRAVLTEAIGGRYRVRAWEAPRLTTTEPQFVFLRADESTELAVKVEPHDAMVLQGALTVPSWQVGQLVAFEALLVQEEVGSDGIIRGRPQLGQVTLAPIAGLRVEDEQVRLTDPASGRVVFPVVCVATGIHQAVLSGSGQSVTVVLPECGPGDVSAPPPEETTTTTTGDGEATTTTTSPPPVAFPVGRTFTVPFDGPLPVGTYTAIGTDTCATSYEVLRAGRWVRQQSAGPTITAVAPVRSLKPAPDTDACTYRRVR